MSFFSLLIGILLACSSFLIPQKTWMAKSYDWHVADGYIIANPSGLQKKSLLVKRGEKASRWVAKYSSVTFNQFGFHFPNGGINEKGLAVEVLWLNETKYPRPDQRPVVNEIEWIQYQLDNFKNVDEIADNLHKIRIRKIYADVHYFACDKRGECLSVEFLNGRAVSHKKANLPYPTLTNNTYANAANYIKRYEGFGGNLKIPYGTYSSYQRFARATDQARDFAVNNDIKDAFFILNTVKKDNYTRWQILYNLSNQEIHFKTTFANKKKAKIEANDFFSHCSKNDTRFFHLSNWQREQIYSMPTLSYNENYQLVEASLNSIYNGKVPKDFIEGVATHPYSFKCVNTN